jgi:hypothetical protein
MQIHGNDHYVVDTVVWQLTTLGIHVNGGGECLLIPTLTSLSTAPVCNSLADPMTVTVD